MVRTPLSAVLALLVVLPLAVAARPAVAAPPPISTGPDGRDVGRVLHRVDGQTLEVPQRYTRTAKRKAAGVTPAVGTVRQWLGYDDTIGYYRKDYTLRGAGDHIEVWVADDLAFPPGDCRNAVPDSTSISDRQVTEMIDEFDRNMYPKETAAFSTPPDRDGSHAELGPDADGNGGEYGGGGERTVTLVDNIRDDNFRVFPSDSTYYAGFFDAFLNESFDRNTMLIDAFDWTHRTTADPPDEPTSDPCTSRTARPWMYESTFAHEWQHLLQYYTDPDEVDWVNEGLSEFAMALVGYSNPAATIDEPGFEVDITCFQGHGIEVTPANPAARDCGGPQNSLNLWNEQPSTGSSVLADYGNAYAFMLLLHDRYGQDFISALHSDGEHQGLAGLQAALEAVGVHDLYRVLHDYQSTILLDRFLDESPNARMRGIARARVTTKSLNSSLNLDNPASYRTPGAAPNGADYVPLAGKELKSLTFTGATTHLPAPLGWSIVTDDQDRTGDPVLFSGNASSTDAAMVTEVTVPTADPTLRFLAKYGAEEGFDYGYVSVSTDGGATYTPIAGDRTVDGPSGPGLSGTTEGFEPHSFDLSAYAGQSVLVSIRYVSDGFVNAGGLLVDDISVGAAAISDGSSLEPFDSPTEIRPVDVHHWNVRLVGMDAKHHVGLQVEFDGRNRVSLSSRSATLTALRRFPQVVAIVAYDEPTEQVRQYAPYTLTVNGVLQPGGTPPS